MRAGAFAHSQRGPTKAFGDTSLYSYPFDIYSVQFTLLPFRSYSLEVVIYNRQLCAFTEMVAHPMSRQFMHTLNALFRRH